MLIERDFLLFLCGFRFGRYIVDNKYFNQSIEFDIFLIEVQKGREIIYYEVKYICKIVFVLEVFKLRRIEDKI